ncbi:hypothetical protein TNCV_404131 [Trichonephila clavipes]|nr:hypothetical protein TNCV_404131 [Trichonephila clavipes]
MITEFRMTKAISPTIGSTNPSWNRNIHRRHHIIGYGMDGWKDGDPCLWWTRHSRVHLAAADKRLRRGRPRNPFFDPRGIEPRRPEDGGEML